MPLLFGVGFFPGSIISWVDYISLNASDSFFLLNLRHSQGNETILQKQSCSPPCFKNPHFLAPEVPFAHPFFGIKPLFLCK